MVYRVKPGRGPSAMGAIGGVVVALFGVVWTIGAASMGAPIFFPLFGVLFVVMAIVGVVYNLHNATGKDRFSTYDVTVGDEEGDPLDTIASPPPRHRSHETRDDNPFTSGEDARRFEGGFCPYCGAAVRDDFNFCPKCGKDI